MNNQNRNLFEKEFNEILKTEMSLTGKPGRDIAFERHPDYPDEYVQLRTVRAYRVWQVAAAKSEQKYKNKIGEIEGLNVAAVLLLKENESQIESLKSEIEQLKNPWISVEDRLPESSGYYLITHSWFGHEDIDYTKIMHFLHTAYETPVMRWYDSKISQLITHWMPLIKLPTA